MKHAPAASVRTGPVGAGLARPFFSALVYVAQFFYGGWFLFHGLNYYCDFFEQPGATPGSQGLIPVLIASGLFDVVKILEIATGALLLANRLVPLAAAVAFPITMVIGQYNFAHHTVRGDIVGITIIAVNSLLAMGHLDRFLPMLAWNSGDPGYTGWQKLRGDSAALSRPAVLRGILHLLAAIIGIAVPVALTYYSIHIRR